MSRHRIVVIGGNNVDINATSETQLVFGDSNPGHIHTGLGGVGRNIAENLARIGQEVSLVTVFGDDEFSSLAQAQAERVGMETAHSISAVNAPSCVYVCINEPDGVMSVAVNDMELCDRITPEFLQTLLPVLNAADAVIVDANISEASIDYLAQQVTAPLFADAVAAKKAGRLHRSLPRLRGLKCNQIEAELLTGITITHEHDMSAAARALHQMGLEYVLITLGSRGAFASDGNAQVFERPFPQRIVNSTGCGDAFTAAAVVAALDHRDLCDLLRLGLAAASMCGQSVHAVSEHISQAALEAYLSPQTN